MAFLSSTGRSRALIIDMITVGLSALLLMLPPLGFAAKVAGLEEPSVLGRKYDALRSQHQDLTYSEFRRRLGPAPDYVRELPVIHSKHVISTSSISAWN